MLGDSLARFGKYPSRYPVALSGDPLASLAINNLVILIIDYQVFREKLLQVNHKQSRKLPPSMQSSDCIKVCIQDVGVSGPAEVLRLSLSKHKIRQSCARKIPDDFVEYEVLPDRSKSKKLKIPKNILQAM
ncbi:hypothetical protein PV328_004121 [Microctonus aethiopoides]|uniref:Uncharacterized protein n=1 Tax=Microctonus aethiopoides TaxID=144406 RepID=A0AA39FA36_9HYME|nr:hypothetical protein PV328_004121 [Microctonus aethiopoides]